MRKDWVILSAAALMVAGCCSRGKFPSDLKAGTPVALVDRDEHVDDWRVNGEDVCTKRIEAVDGCYVLEAKYSADYMRLHGGHSRLWSLSLVAGAIDTASRVPEGPLRGYKLMLRAGFTGFVQGGFQYAFAR